MSSKKVIKKIDWFLENTLKETFNSYQHAAEHFQEYYNEPNISNVTVSRLFIKNNTNIKFDKTGNKIIPVYKNISFDIREHNYTDDDQLIENRVCTYCKISKPFTEQHFYINETRRGKCRECNVKVIGDKPVKEFMDKLKLDKDNWKNHHDYEFIYFERDTEEIFNIKSGKSITNVRSIRNMTGKHAIHIKWEIFNGSVPENKIIRLKNTVVPSIALDNIECVYIKCENCDKIIEKPDALNRYCGKKCQTSVKVFKERELRHTNMDTYLMTKYSSQKYLNKEIDYDVDHLKSLGKICFYCNIECTFGNDDYTSDALTFDKKNSKITYIKSNVVPCCYFCNVMKNVTVYEDWMQFINFVKDPAITQLDLSNHFFGKTSRDIDTTCVYSNLKKQSPDYYPNRTDPKDYFMELCKKQKYKDYIFNFFPIIYLDRNCLWNASIDAIDSDIICEHKHRPTNLQIIPKLMNYGKHVHSVEHFLHEWEKRGFKTDFSNCRIILPDNYEKECYFHKMINKPLIFK